ncbi:MAG: glycine--tRNA ligase subunit beta, partial [Chloroflexota bacterium]|nr:glycine--tRNA ligase subunit beta [Chloroflexota bacterium]
RVADRLGVRVDEAMLMRAARLAKADLATALVKELTELQGEMGRAYALAGGEPEPVAAAIAEHYLPRVVGDALPAGDLGLVLGVADRVDTLTAGFAAGLEPTGSSDPYGLRRQALGLILLLVERGIPVSLDRLVSLAAEHSPVPLTDERREALGGFLRQRLRVWLTDQGHAREVVDAVLAVQGDTPSLAARTIVALERALTTDDFQRLMAGVKRADRIAPRDGLFELDASALVEPAEQDLLTAYRVAAERAEALSPADVEGLVAAVLPLADPIDRFFVDVMVMVDDQRIRSARLALLQRIRDLPRRSFEVAQIPTTR